MSDRTNTSNNGHVLHYYIRIDWAFHFSLGDQIFSSAQIFTIHCFLDKKKRNKRYYCYQNSTPPYVLFFVVLRIS